MALQHWNVYMYIESQILYRIACRVRILQYANLCNYFLCHRISPHVWRKEYIGTAKQQNKDVLKCRTLTVGGWWWYTIRRHCGGSLAKQLYRIEELRLAATICKRQDISVDGPYKVVRLYIWGSRLPTVLATAVSVLCVWMLHNKLSRMRCGMKTNTTVLLNTHAFLEQFNYIK